MSVTPIRLGLLSRTNQIVVSKGACGMIAPALEWAYLVLTYLKPLKKRKRQLLSTNSNDINSINTR